MSFVLVCLGIQPANDPSHLMQKVTPTIVTTIPVQCCVTTHQLCVISLKITRTTCSETCMFYAGKMYINAHLKFTPCERYYIKDRRDFKCHCSENRCLQRIS